MTIKRLLSIVFPDTVADIRREGFREKYDDFRLEKEEQRQTYEKRLETQKENWEKRLIEEVKSAHTTAYEQAKKELIGKTYVSLGEELMFPMNFTDYNSPEERERIAAVVGTAEWQQYFKHNIICQAMKKWRDARTQSNPQMMAIFNIVGNQFMELVEFYDNAPNIQQDSAPKSNFNSLLEDE